MIQHQLCKVIGKVVGGLMYLLFPKFPGFWKQCRPPLHCEEGRERKQKEIFYYQCRVTENRALWIDRAQSRTKTPSSAPSLGQGVKIDPPG